ncbi:alpha/beta fold hydrolase [uncultured Neptuniibacter sp.]|uniref:alpha/beta fold hydrolase n=1 Tax=uncultured Neptuniibacter sp. TaxID=502143 RepID=UPI002639ADC0|nr:alpha/beta fold hydrolase [uncultured Neptuniibacter sp.]
MLLNFQIHGEGQPLIILHGLFGTLENWGAQIKSLSEHFQVIAVDLRNHGRSPHSDEISYQLMADDLRTLISHLNLDTTHIIGHSMGGKAAMQLALTSPELIDKLIIVDIAPVSYGAHHNDVFEGLFSINLNALKSRSEADQTLANSVAEPGVRAFLLKNLYRDENKQFNWRMNLQSLHKHYAEISAAPSGQTYTDPVLFIKGAKSDYLIPEYRESVLNFFPRADYKVIKEAGHWPHAEKPAEFTQIILQYLER